ncbi:MAG: xanthine dehydrogenase family protein subunit M [Halieaceae bacterium]|jgi:CO/xanthine dehydrogenase FAD-binding subunit|nr:xanthine dehydrogenase family protein subunit M [Halieaceae bacterium]
MSTRVLTDFDLVLPGSLSEALDILAQNGSAVTVVAGGTDILVAMKAGFKADMVMSLTALPDLDYLDYDASSGLRIGANASIAQVVDSADVERHYPALWQAAKIFATPQLRNTATVVGNLLRGSPAGDCCAAVAALGGSLTMASAGSTRELDIDDLWVAYGTTARADNELAVELKIPAPAAGRVSAFKRLTRVNEDLAKLNVAVSLQMDGSTCSDVRLAMGCVAPTMIRLPSAEAVLEGSELNSETLEKAAAAVQEDISPIDDQRSTAEYRRGVAGVYLKRAVEQACSIA